MASAIFFSDENLDIGGAPLSVYVGLAGTTLFARHGSHLGHRPHSRSRGYVDGEHGHLSPALRWA
jgi:hypothetical protein